MGYEFRVFAADTDGSGPGDSDSQWLLMGELLHASESGPLFRDALRLVLGDSVYGQIVARPAAALLGEEEGAVGFVVRGEVAAVRAGVAARILELDDDLDGDSYAWVRGLRDALSEVVDTGLDLVTTYT